jgi:hypothetical protein
VTAAAIKARLTWQFGVQDELHTVPAKRHSLFPSELSAVRREKLAVDLGSGNQFSNGGLLLPRTKARAELADARAAPIMLTECCGGNRTASPQPCGETRS